jgi:hypothetical protein
MPLPWWEYNSANQTNEHGQVTFVLRQGTFDPNQILVSGFRKNNLKRKKGKIVGPEIQPAKPARAPPSPNHLYLSAFPKYTCQTRIPARTLGSIPLRPPIHSDRSTAGLVATDSWSTEALSAAERGARPERIRLGLRPRLWRQSCADWLGATEEEKVLQFFPRHR